MHPAVGKPAQSAYMYKPGPDLYIADLLSHKYYKENRQENEWYESKHECHNPISKHTSAHPYDMTCFLFRKKYKAEVMLHVVLRYDTILYGHYI